MNTCGGDATLFFTSSVLCLGSQGYHDILVILLTANVVTS